MTPLRRILPLGLVAGLLAAEPASACSVCFGDPSSAMTKGALAGVLLLLAVIVGVLITIATVALQWSRRARMLEATQAAAERSVGGEPPAA